MYFCTINVQINRSSFLCTLEFLQPQSIHRVAMATLYIPSGEKISLGWWGGGCKPTPFHYSISTIKYKVVVWAPEGRYLPPVSPLPLYVLCCSNRPSPACIVNASTLQTLRKKRKTGKKGKYCYSVSDGEDESGAYSKDRKPSLVLFYGGRTLKEIYWKSPTLCCNRLFGSPPPSLP